MRSHHGPARFLIVASIVLASLRPLYAEARLGPGDPVYDAVAKRVQIPIAPNVEVVERNPPNTIKLYPYRPELRNLRLLASVLRWNEKEPGVTGDIQVYKPSGNTLGSVASLERSLRRISHYREPASAAEITEDQTGGPRNDVWCPATKDPRATALAVEIVLVDGVPALNLKTWPSGELPECSS